MKPLSRIQLLQACFATLLTLTLILHPLFSQSALLSTLTHHKSLLLSFTFTLFLSLFLFLKSRQKPVFLLGYSCFKPEFDRKCSFEAGEYFLRRSRRFSTASVEFMRGICRKSGLGDETYGPPFIFQQDYEAKHKSAVQEAEEGMFSAVESVLSKAKIDPRHIDALIVTCGMFSPSPSLSSLIVNRFQLKPSIKSFNLSGMGCSSGVVAIDLAAKILGSAPLRSKPSYALVVITESISLNWYFGENRSMLVTNCIFRVGCAAALLTNDPARRRDAKLELLGSLRTHHGADDRAYCAALQAEDDKGNVGVALTKDLVRVAGEGLRAHIRSLAPLVLPYSQLVAYVYCVAAARFARGGEKAAKPRVPDFATAFEHVCIHTGGKAVIETIGRQLRLGDEVTEPARMVLHRFGNTSSSLVFYELAYFEAKSKIKKGDRMWMLAFGTGFKVCSLVWKALADTCADHDNPWLDCIHRYPLKAW